MIHGKKNRTLGRKKGPRKALLKNLAKQLIAHKKIVTTTAKAKELRPYIEKIITKAKNNSTHSRRIVFSYFQDKSPVKMLFNEIALRIGDRPGGYTRILNMPPRKGDHARMSLIEIVDYNTIFRQKKKAE